MKKILFFILSVFCLIVVSQQGATAQGATCAAAEAACFAGGIGIDFPAAVGNSAESGNNYGCLATAPNPSWFYVQLDNGGTVDVEFAAALDIDYAIWGPFADLSSATSTCGALGSPISCSYSTSPVEMGSFSGNSGEVFLVLVTNYASSAQSVSFSQTGGTGTTDCGIVSGLPNDECSGAIPVACNIVTSGSNVGALPDTDTGCSTAGVVNFASGIWYSLDNVSGSVTVSTCSNSNFDTELVVYEGTCGALTCIEGHDFDDCGSLDETITFTATAGSSYLIYVTGHAGASGNFELLAACTPVGLPNDECSGAIPVACNTVTSGSNVGALPDTDTGCSTLGVVNFASGIWYSLDNVSGSVTVSTCNNSDFDTELVVYEGTCGALTCIEGHDSDDCGSLDETITFTATAGSSYLIYVTGHAGSQGNFELSVVCTPDCAFTTSVTNVVCRNDRTGTATATPSGGVAPYTYTWNSIPPQFNQTAVGLGAGNYNVTVTDANGCSQSATVTITQPALSVEVTATTGTIACAGGTTSATASAINGTSPYIYTWSDGQTGAVATLGAGTYTVVATDNLGCADDFDFSIGQPSVLTCSATAVAANCADNNGTATASATGGTPGYTYNWSNGQTTAAATGLAQGSYTVTVSDTNNCTCLAIVDVSAIGAPLMTVSANEDEGNGGPLPIDFNTNVITVEGGAMPYSFEWDNDGYVVYDIEYSATGATITIYYNDAAEWSVTITDNTGCTNGSLVASNQNTGTNSILDINNHVITGESSSSLGAIDITASGGGAGCAPYTYLWSNGATTQDITGIASGWYSVTVTCANGSQHTVGWYWVPKQRRGRSKTDGDVSGLAVMPNPFANEATVTFSPQQSGRSTVSLYSMDGRWVSELYSDYTEADQVYSVPLSSNQLSSGLYMVVWRDEHGNTEYHRVALTK